MAVLFRHKMLWLATPRTASTATCDALLRAGGKQIGLHHDSLEQVNRRHGEPVVTTIRNPYDILVTWWLSGNDPGPFPGFILGFKERNFLRDGRLLYHAPTADIVVRYENLDVELPAAFKKCGLESVALERVNVTKGKANWRRYYDADAIEAANRRFGAEIEQHGYELLRPSLTRRPPPRRA